MPKKPTTKLGRRVLLFIATCAAISTILVLVILLFEAAGPIHAALWHMRHGSTISFDGHRFHLPLSWYPDPDNHPGQLGLQRAQFGSDTITHITLATEPRKLNDHDAIDEIAAMRSHLNAQESNPAAQWRTETLQTRSLTLHCTMSTQNGNGETLICQAAGSNLRILAITAGRTTQTAALNIIETSE